MKKIKLFLGILFSIVFLACSNDNDSKDHENSLIGVWRRIDFSDSLEHRLTFNSNQTGSEYFHEGSFTNTSDFTWNANNNILNITITDTSENYSFNYVINSNGQLVLENEPELTYDKIE